MGEKNGTEKWAKAALFKRKEKLSHTGFQEGGVPQTLSARVLRNAAEGWGKITHSSVLVTMQTGERFTQSLYLLSRTGLLHSKPSFSL